MVASSRRKLLHLECAKYSYIMQQEPLISVVIPAYNEAQSVRQAIASIQNQTYHNLEIIVVDDHSTDDTPHIIKAIAAEDPRVSYHRTPQKPKVRKNWRGYDINAGYAARAYGFSIARGEWITTQDADDASLLNRIEVQYTLAKKYNATLVTIEWQSLTEQKVGKRLDVARLFAEYGEETFAIPPQVIQPLVSESIGPLMRLPFHRFIPFPFKWFPYTRWLFYGTFRAYPGADNCMFFKRAVIAAGINFRPRNERAWGIPTGRGTGRDFLFHVAAVFKNSWSFKLPLYLWNVKAQNPATPSYAEYLII